MENVVHAKVRASTLCRHGEIIRIHIIPHLGGVLVRQLRSRMVQDLYRRLEAVGASPRTREMAHKLVSQAIKQALRWGEVSHTIMDAVDKPRVARKEIQV